MDLSKITLKYLFWTMTTVLLVGTGTSFLFTPVHMFHCLNPLAMALGIVILIVYSPGWVDAWKNRFESITPAHLLTFGVSLNWLGFIVRLGRWYFTAAEPANGMPQWFYNVGLWVSIWAGLFLIGAAQLVTKPYRVSTLISIFLMVFALLFAIDFTDILVLD